MKIKKIVLFNIGPYLDRNEFDLTMDSKKNIVLIGGKNGAGKTTFFKSIKTCLYGCKVWGYDAPGKEYYTFIETLVNTKLQYNSAMKAYVELELEFDDGKQKTSYLLHREWTKMKKGIQETFSVSKDGMMLDKENLVDFNNYLLSIIPPDMFNFYFFDGEAIAEFFLGTEGKKNFRNAFLKLYGLDTLSLMVENFERYFKKKGGTDAVQDQYQNAKRALETIQDKIAEEKRKKTELEEQVDLIEISLQTLQSDYEKNGGINILEWRKINQEIAQEESHREEINRWLKDIANHYLPFILLKKQLKELAVGLEHEQETQKGEAIQGTLSSVVFFEKLETYLKENRVDNLATQELIDFICAQTAIKREGERIFDFSSMQIARILTQIEEKVSFDEKDILKKLRELKASGTKNKQLKDALNNSSIDGYEEYSQEKERLEKRKTGLIVEIEKQAQEIALLELKRQNAVADYEKAKEKYLQQIKEKSINDMSQRAIAAYTVLEEQLIRRQSDILQKEFIKSFTSIINKDNFLDGIVIDNNINIIPYKMIDVSFLQIENYLQANSKTDFLQFFDVRYWKDISDLKIGAVESIRLPSPITAPFSQGERQVYIMSIYLALLKTSRKDVPFFIDTPFARIDSNHRDRIVKNFFKGVKNQLFILSTDEEIVGKYKKLISTEISDQFLLTISDYGQTKIVEDAYFGE